MKAYNPPFLFRNRHFQSVVPSLKFRRPFVKRRVREMIKASEEVLIDAGDGVRLQGFYSENKGGSGDLAVLIHGWEGSGDSIYLLSAAGRLYREGFSVFRLNMRDHGSSHYLNKELFHSCMLQEVVNGVKVIKDRYSGSGRTFLVGFSLGGNFALRVAAAAPNESGPDRVIAVCPVLYPPSTMDAIDNGCPVYQKYFIRKWKKSLKIKMRLFPGEYEFSGRGIYRSLESMTDYFIERYTEFPDLYTYLKGYAVTGDRLKGLETPSHIIVSRDDPVIPFKDTDNLASSEKLKIDVVDYGGHCGFLKGFSFESWADDRIVEILNEEK